ncbi:MAG TPA: hypothetical protein VNZ43_00615 [Sphingomonadaceae bacterium]|jgi:hypothetical protein|nr:hypothetical protein [Sphingomonadaceae bacterium]
MQEMWWWLAGVAAALICLAIVADRRRMRRRNIDRPGWVPWPLVLILSLIALIACTIFALGGTMAPR